MIQAGWRRVLGMGGVLGGLLLGLGGCSAERSSTRVDEEWLARVPPEQMEEVRKVRLVHDKAMDETVRAEVALDDANRELDIARANEEAAQSRRDADEDALSAARETAQASSIVQAQQRLREAEMELAAAQAETAFREQTVRTREALTQMRQRELAVADAELALAEYQALQKSGDLRAREISGQELADNLEQARRAAWETQTQVDASIQRQRQARARWQQLDAQLQGYGGSGRQ